MSTFKSRTLSVTINRNWRDVYSYAAEPANMVHWAAGLGAGFEGEGLEWKAHGAGGTAVRIRFTQRNEFGVLDHDVFVDGRIVHVPLRVMPNGDGAEVSFLLLQTPDLDDAAFERDAEAVNKDLQTLKAIMEDRAGGR
ncbi:hypothetical protein SAMN05216456_1188 [Devosia crocina]|uniref:Polyketide cyclase / dehydrase and lipid transport n=1 Tax=Devosia crocina TaxID=429728 RepID=A0A1I7N8F3_9HYPH|nr:hypothetical protein [Devosia crocina]SFV30962.1 hypothetical protein SAMN05216456_1188 [Devosia crocina]